MPSLLALIACERVIQEQHGASLITLLEDIQVGVISGAKVPPGTTIPMNWWVYTTWRAEPGDNGKTFEQRLLLFNPGGQLIMETAPHTFSFETRMVHVTTKFSNFPISHEGECPLKVEIREVGEQAWISKASYPFNITHAPAPAGPRPSNTVIWHKV